MSDLISREALLAVPNVRKVVEYDETGEYIRYFAVPEDVIKNAPAVDAVEVVRCRDCKDSRLLRDTNFKNEYPWRYYHEDSRLCLCHLLIEDEPIRVEDDCYCAYGTRRKTGENELG